MPSLNPQEIRQILDALESSAWDEAAVTVGDVSISVARNGATLSPAAANPAAGPGIAAANPPQAAPAGPLTSATSAAASVPAAPPSEAPPTAAGTPTGGVGGTTPGGVDVLSPTVGLFWRAPQPGAPPFAEVGQQVEVGDVLCIVEVMKLMNNVQAEVAGTVTAIHVANAGSVEFGQVLMTITPSNG